MGLRRGNGGSLGVTLPRKRTIPVAKFIADLGGDANVIGLYFASQAIAPGTVTTTGSGVSLWRDVRGSNRGPDLVQATDSKRPPRVGVQIECDGVDDFLVSSAAGRLAEITAGNFAVALVGTMPTGGVAAKHAHSFIHNFGGTVYIAARTDAAGDVETWVGVTGTAIAVANRQAGIRVLHSRRSQAGGNFTPFMRFGGGVEQSGGIAAQAASTATELNVAALSGGAATSNVKVRMILIYKGSDYTSANRFAVVNAFAEKYLGAIL